MCHISRFHSLTSLLKVGVIGFEPIQHYTTDLQSAPSLQLRRTPVYSFELLDAKYLGVCC